MRRPRGPSGARNGARGRGNQFIKASAKRCRAERSREPLPSTHPPSVCCLGSSRDPCAANQMAAVAQHLPPQSRATKKAPGEVQTPPLRGLFGQGYRPAVTAPVLYHTFPASSIPPPPRQNSGPSPRGGRWVGLSLAPALSTSAALRSKPPTTHAQQKIAARELTKSAGRGIITARSSISLNIRLLAQIWQNFAIKCI